jgi:hypothetical protein
MGYNTKIDLQEMGWGDGKELSGSEYGPAACASYCGNETSDSVKCRALACQEGVCCMEEEEEEEEKD